MLSYRREDSGLIAGRICDRLRTQYGRDAVYMDIDSAPIGVDYRTHIKDSLARCDVLLAVIGPHWLGTGEIGERRIDEPDDLVRLEVANALARDIRVVPLLIEDAQMPSREELPEDLKGLKYRNALRIDSGVDFHHHLDRLCKAIEAVRPVSPPATLPVSPPAAPPVSPPAAPPVSPQQAGRVEAHEAPLPPPPPEKRKRVSTSSTPPPLSTTFVPPRKEKKEPPSQSPISTFAIASLVCLPLIPVLSIVLGHLARKEIRRNPSLRGDELALAGLIVGYCLAALGVIIIIVYLSSPN